MRQAESDGALSGHGGRVDVARALYPGAAQPWIDLSTGINPVPWRPDPDLRIDVGPLPSGTALRDLEAAAARRFGVGPERIAALPGSEIGLRLLRFAGLPEPLLRVGPGYATHGAVASAMLSHDALDRYGGGTILLANPNNPDGRRLSPEHLADLAARQARSGGWLVVDEAFADTDPATSVLPLLDDTDPVIVLRSFGKFFGLAGLRLGFAVAPGGVIARFRSLLGDWPVSTHAIAYGTAAYRDDAWISRARIALADRAAGLDRLLERHGLLATGACPLFRLVDHPQALAIFERLAQAGILVRAFDYAPSWLRFGLPADDAAFDRLDRALAGG